MTALPTSCANRTDRMLGVTNVLPGLRVWVIRVIRFVLATTHQILVAPMDATLILHRKCAMTITTVNLDARGIAADLMLKGGIRGVIVLDLQRRVVDQRYGVHGTI